MTVAQAETEAYKVKKLLARITLDVRSENIPLCLVSRDQMSIMNTSSYAKEAVGLAVKGYSPQNPSTRVMSKIVILYGLPRIYFSSVFAHELGHAWMWLNKFPDLENQVEEGLCRLFEYIWLRQQHSPESLYHQHLVEKDQSKIYGDGFRLAQVKFKQHHLIELLDYVKTHKHFPQ